MGLYSEVLNYLSILDLSLERPCKIENLLHNMVTMKQANKQVISVLIALRFI